MSDLTSSQETYEERLRDNFSGGFENSFTINPNKPNIASTPLMDWGIGALLCAAAYYFRNS